MPLRITGTRGAITYLHQLRDRSGRFTRLLPSVGSSLPYAYGIHEGRHRGGRLARRAGGVFYLKRAAESVLPRAEGMLARGLATSEQAMQTAVRVLGQDLVRAAQNIVVVRSGRLRRSIGLRGRG